ncbi:MAG: hypothetical protein V4633_13585 [Pseudomonadota bacterium]
MGLLDQFAGLGNMSEDQTNGLLAFGTNMLQNSGPSQRPVSFGQVLGNGLQAYQGSMSEAKRRKLEEQQQRQMAEMRAMQMRDMQSDYANQEAMRGEAARVAKFRSTWGQGAAPQPAAQPVLPELGSQPMQSTPGMAMPESQQAPSQAAGRYQQGMAYAQAARAQGMESEAIRAETEALKFKPEVKNWQEVNVNGKIQYAPYFADGTSGAPVPFEVARKLTTLDNGQSNDMIDPYTGKMVSTFGKKQTLESIASNSTTMRGQNMTDARQRDLNAITRQGQQTQIFNDPERGMILVDKSTGQARPATAPDGSPFRGEAAVKRESASNKLLPLLTQADSLIGSATGSYGGAAVDQVGRVFGAATNGADTIAKLKVIEGQLMMAQPRMEGPQSNTDVMLYRQMAGQIGDPTVPQSMKAAALATVRALAEKYASPEAIAADKVPGANGGWSIKKVP